MHAAYVEQAPEEIGFVRALFLELYATRRTTSTPAIRGNLSIGSAFPPTQLPVKPVDQQRRVQICFRPCRSARFRLVVGGDRQYRPGASRRRPSFSTLPIGTAACCRRRAGLLVTSTYADPSATLAMLHIHVTQPVPSVVIVSGAAVVFIDWPVAVSFSLLLHITIL